MKYIMFTKETPSLVHRVPFIFPNNMVHSMVAEEDFLRYVVRARVLFSTVI